MNVCVYTISIRILYAYVYLSYKNKFMNLPDKFSKLHLEFLEFHSTKMLRTIPSSEE